MDIGGKHDGKKEFTSNHIDHNTKYLVSLELTNRLSVLEVESASAKISGHDCIDCKRLRNEETSGSRCRFIGMDEFLVILQQNFSITARIYRGNEINYGLKFP